MDWLGGESDFVQDLGGGCAVYVRREGGEDSFFADRPGLGWGKGGGEGRRVVG